MTPKEKADKLCMRFLIETTTDIPYGVNKIIAKECALIAVNEIMKAGINPIDRVFYWEEVKKEIEAL
jgi:hypothetical protein